MSSKQDKMEEDFSPLVDVKIPENRALALQVRCNTYLKFVACLVLRSAGQGAYSLTVVSSLRSFSFLCQSIFIWCIICHHFLRSATPCGFLGAKLILRVSAGPACSCCGEPTSFGEANQTGPICYFSENFRLNLLCLRLR